jgi:hypothetical protein
MACHSFGKQMNGGGDGNRTHVRRKSNQKYYMFSFRLYKLVTLETDIASRSISYTFALRNKERLCKKNMGLLSDRQ